MKRWGLIVLLAMLCGAAGSQPAGNDDGPARHGKRSAGDDDGLRARRSTVVVELFTSQGCSSCPPADALLHRIANDPSLRGRVIPLAYHVDYWNHLGWRDPFSSRAWTQRQHEYLAAMKQSSAYTPQAVINGSRQMVGSSSVEIYRAIEEESKRKSAASLSVKIDGGNVVVRGHSSQKDVDLVVIAYENGAVTKVERGENTGKTIENDAIVRKLVRAGTFGAGAIEARVPMTLGPRMGVVAMLQDGATRRILAAATSPFERASLP